jgi:hypothetical protein
MRVQALKDLLINGKSIRAGEIVRLAGPYARKLIRDGLVRALDSPAEKLETK